MSTKNWILDVDFGGTVDDNEDVPDWTPENNSLQSTIHPDPNWNGHLNRQPFPGCLNTFRLLRNNGFAPIGVVSKITMKQLIQVKIRRWLTHHGFDEVIPQELVRFCATWEEKLGLCFERGATHFIDNNLMPIAPMVDKIPHLYLFWPLRVTHNRQNENNDLWHLIEEGKITLVNSWAEFGEKVLSTIN